MSAFDFPFMHEGIALNGVWWLPNTPQVKCWGTLTFSPESGCRLEVIGSLGGNGNSFMSDQEFPVILGRSTAHNGQPITAFDALQIGSTLTSGISTATYFAHVLAIGIHIENESREFTKSRIHLSNIEKWISSNHSITDKFGYEISGIELARDKELDFSTRTLDSRIQSETHHIHRGNGITNREIAVRRFLSITPINPMPISWHIKIAGRISWLISLLMGNASVCDQLVLEGEVLQALPSGNEVREELYVYYQPVGAERVSGQAPVVEFATHADRILDDLSRVFDRWFASDSTIEHLVNLLFAVDSRPALFLEFRFLGLVQGLESYHRRKNSEGIMPEVDFKEVYDAVLADFKNRFGTDHSLFETLKSRLTYANEISLRRRIQMLLSNIGNEAAISIAEDLKEFSDRIVEIRNYLTHYPPRRHRLKDYSEDLFILILKLKALANLVLLLELGFSEQSAVDIWKRCRAFKEMRDFSHKGQSR
jgi:hypothetical protein